MGQRIFVLGATSAIAEAIMRTFCANPSAAPHFALVARNQNRLDVIARDLTVRGATVSTHVADLSSIVEAQTVTDWASKTLGGIDVALLAYGDLGNHAGAIASTAATAALINTNYTSAAAHLTAIANVLEKQKSGVICALSSVAGDRGRQSNYVYGSAKGALTIFLAGMRNRLFASGVRVVTIKHGFVDTPMTKDIKKGALWATPASVAPTVVRAIATKNRDVYVPAFWCFIMCIIKSIPERIFVKLKL